MEHDLHKHLRHLSLEDREEFYCKITEAFHAINYILLYEKETPSQWVGRLNVAYDIVADMKDVSSYYIKPGA